MNQISNLGEIKEVAAHLARIRAKPRSLYGAVVEEHVGSYWKDKVDIRFDKQTGHVRCFAGPNQDAEYYLPTDEEQAAIRAVWPMYRFPQHMLTVDIPNPNDIIKEGLRTGKCYKLWVKDAGVQKIAMLQVRMPEGSDAKYTVWTYYSDSKWRAMEPSGSLPLFGIDRIWNAAGTQKQMGEVWIHEGPKAAARCNELADMANGDGAWTQAERQAALEHPRIEDIRKAHHVGFLGGALDPLRTDWSTLRGGDWSRVLICPDNDRSGLSAVKKIAIELEGMPVDFINHAGKTSPRGFPNGFDLADKFLESMFDRKAKPPRYVGPSMGEMVIDCAVPGSFQTFRPGGRGNPIRIFNGSDQFIANWSYSHDLERWVSHKRPLVLFSKDQFNNYCMTLCGVKYDYHSAFLSNTTIQDFELIFDPSLPTGATANSEDKLVINQHVRSKIVAWPEPVGEGELVSPWLKYLKHLIPDSKERTMLAEWVAILIASPENWLKWGVFLWSDAQGVGKSTLGERILTPILGKHNVGRPNQDEVEGKYNEWAARRRLVLLEEFTGGTRTMNQLKDIQSGEYVRISQKYEKSYDITNRTCLLGTSNNPRALKIQSGDRRWFIPKVRNKRMDFDFANEFTHWLNHEGGLSKTVRWAHDYVDSMKADGRLDRFDFGQAAKTEAKKQMADDVLNEAQQQAAAIWNALVEKGRRSKGIGRLGVVASVGDITVAANEAVSSDGGAPMDKAKTRAISQGLVQVGVNVVRGIKVQVRVTTANGGSRQVEIVPACSLDDDELEQMGERICAHLMGEGFDEGIGEFVKFEAGKRVGLDENWPNCGVILDKQQVQWAWDLKDEDKRRVAMMMVAVRALLVDRKSVNSACEF